MIRNEYQLANIFKNFFINIVPNLGIKIDQQYIFNSSSISDLVEKTIKKHQRPSSISIIKKIVSSADKEAAFSFTCITPDDISKVIKRLTLRENSPYSELFWSVFSRIWTEYRQIPRISLYSVQMQENADQNNLTLFTVLTLFTQFEH